MEEAYFYFHILLSFTASDENENLFWNPRNRGPIFATVKLYFCSYHAEKTEAITSQRWWKHVHQNLWNAAGKQVQNTTVSLIKE